MSPPSGTTYVYDEALTITATPAPGWEFVNWTGDTGNLDDENSAVTTLISPLTVNTNVTANFVKTDYTLTWAVNGNGSVSPPSGTTYVYDEALTITATPAPGWEFVNWTGDTGNLDDENSAVTTLISPLTVNTNVTANFVKTDYTLTWAVNGNGSVSPPSGTTYVYDEALTITATPAPGWEFVNWTGDTGNLDDENSAVTTLISPLTVNTNVTANFVKTDYTLTWAVNGNGSVSPPSGTTYVYDEALTITATPAPGWEFVNWTGDTGNLDDENSAVTTLISPLTVNTNVTANFVKTDYTLTWAVNGNGSVSPPSGTTYVYDEALTITATPAPGWEFVNWTGDTGNLLDSTSASTALKNPLTANTDLTANFILIDYTLTVTSAGGTGGTTDRVTVSRRLGPIIMGMSLL